MLGLLFGGIHQAVRLAGGGNIGFRAVRLRLIFHIGVQVGIGLRSGHTAGILSAVPDDAVVPDLGADDPVILALRPVFQGVIRGVRVAAVQIHHRVDAHPHIVLAVQRQQHLHDPGADQVVVLFLQLQLQLGGTFHIPEFRIGGVGVAVGVADLHVLHAQPGHAMADQVADGLHLVIGESLAVLHGHLHGGAGLHLIAAVQHIGVILAGREQHTGLFHTVHIADDRGHIVLQVVQNQLVPLRLGGQAAHMVHISPVVITGGGIPCHQDLGHQRGLLVLRHQDRVPVHPVIRDSVV